MTILIGSPHFELFSDFVASPSDDFPFSSVFSLLFLLSPPFGPFTALYISCVALPAPTAPCEALNIVLQVSGSSHGFSPFFIFS